MCLRTIKQIAAGAATDKDNGRTGRLPAGIWRSPLAGWEDGAQGNGAETRKGADSTARAEDGNGSEDGGCKGNVGCADADRCIYTGEDGWGVVGIVGNARLGRNAPDDRANVVVWFVADHT